MKILNSKIIVLTIFLLSFQTINSQQFMSAEELEKLLDRAEEQSQNYSKVFQNLSAEEIKIKIYYKPDGSLDEKRIIKSVFVVYQSPNTKAVQEFRNVTEFNGKNVTRDEKEISKFFDKLTRADTLKEEYEKLFKESVRFDGRSYSWGTTLTQIRPFMPLLRKDFRFQVVGRDKLEGRDVWVIEYEQIKTSPHILANPTSDERKSKQWAIEYNVLLSDDFRPTNPLLKGKIWLDTETAQLWRNDFKVIIYPKTLSKPVETIHKIFEYQPSNFGILVPKKVETLTSRVKGKNDQTLSVSKNEESIYEYSKFVELKTEAKDKINLR